MSRLSFSIWKFAYRGKIVYIGISPHPANYLTVVVVVVYLYVQIIFGRWQMIHKFRRAGQASLLFQWGTKNGKYLSKDNYTWVRWMGTLTCPFWQKVPSRYIPVTPWYVTHLNPQQSSRAGMGTFLLPSTFPKKRIFHNHQGYLIQE